MIIEEEPVELYVDEDACKKLNGIYTDGRCIVRLEKETETLLSTIKFKKLNKIKIFFIKIINVIRKKVKP